ncbi:hypothetical protein Tsp_07258 [Trichinella spiralis]|uniref:hypothetical protein n=1 Tax=Trichinella spiralis TaxID=6334 RepID=UPI0001EFC32E|nr:hypothetical protein Tsp_07258 [Trichinella spiralis]
MYLQVRLAKVERIGGKPDDVSSSPLGPKWNELAANQMMYLQVRLAKVERIGGKPDDSAYPNSIETPSIFLEKHHQGRPPHIHSSLKPPEIFAAGKVDFIICFWLASRSWRSTWCACMNAAVRVLLHFRPHPTTAPDRREIEMLIADFLMNLHEELFLTS